MSLLSSRPDPTFHNGVVIGWRAWKVSGGDLLSITSGTRWPHYKRLEATHVDLARQHEETGHGGEAPCFDQLHCGIYAYQSPSDLHANVGSVDAWGEVKLWGRIIRHEQLAYRAQYAYPSLVIVRDELTATLVRRLYGCEVLVDEQPAPATTQHVPPGAYVTMIGGGGGGGGPISQGIPGGAASAWARNMAAPVVAGQTRMVNLSWHTWSGTSFNYSGVADAATIAHWFEGVLAVSLANLHPGTGFQGYGPMQYSFWMA